MTTPVETPSLFLSFMDSVNVDGHNSIVMRSHAMASDASCLELDIRLHGTHPKLTYMVGLVEENVEADHPETGKAVVRANKFKELLGFPTDTPQIDDYYLGPFDEDTVLSIMGAADHTAARLDFEEQADKARARLEALENKAHAFGELSRMAGQSVDLSAKVEKARIREARKGMFYVIPGGKAAAP